MTQVIVKPVACIIDPGIPPTLAEDQVANDGEKVLSRFWSQIDGVVKSSPNGSMLRNIARLDLNLMALPEDEAKKVMHNVQSSRLQPPCSTIQVE